MKRHFRIPCIAVTLAAGALMAAGCGGKPTSGPTLTLPGIQPIGKTPPTNKEPSSIVALSQDQLAKEYLSDQEATKKKYAGKFLEIAGVVWTAKSDNIADIPQLLLRVYKDPAKWNGNNRCE